MMTMSNSSVQIELVRYQVGRIIRCTRDRAAQKKYEFTRGNARCDTDWRRERMKRNWSQFDAMHIGSVYQRADTFDGA